MRLLHSRSLRFFALLAATAAVLGAAGCGGGGGGGSSGSSDGYLLAGQSDLIEKQLPGGQPKVLLHFNDSTILDPSVSPDGRSLVFVRVPEYTTTTTDFGTDIYAADRDGNNPRLLVKHGQTNELLRFPTFLADGKTLIFQVQGNASANGLPLSRIDRFDTGSGRRSTFVADGMMPFASRDGKSVVYQTLASADGTATIWLTDDTGEPRQKLLSSNAQVGAFGWTAFSPDGSQIALGAAAMNTAAVWESRPAVPAANTGGFAMLRLTRFLNDGLPEDVWLVNRDGSNLRRVTPLREDQPSLAWSSDGKRIYSMGGSGLWQIDVSKGDKRKVGEGIFHGEIVWAPAVSQ
jgi:Tol biopolymer transport system component